MTSLVAGIIGPSNTGVDMPNWNLAALQTAEIIGMSEDTVTFHVGSKTVTLTGHDFSFDVDGGNTSLAGGTITGLTVAPYPPPPTTGTDVVAPNNYAISDFSLDVTDFNALVAANDVHGYLVALFHGDDQLQGGQYSDSLVGMRGNDHLDGAEANDSLQAGHGNDVLIGGAGADWLAGGRGADNFVFTSANDSGNGSYDTIARFNVAEDHIIVPHAITGVNDSIDAGTSDLFNVEANLTAALDTKHHLAAHHAVVATVEVDLGPDPASNTPVILETFLVVDVNGVAGYQSGEDLAILISNPHGLDHLRVNDFISPTVSAG